MHISHPSTKRLYVSLPDPMRVHLASCGFEYLIWLPKIRVNHGLLIDLIERFHSKTQTFHLPIGEITVTLEDVYKILRIPFHGQRLDYVSLGNSGLLAFRHLFRDDT